MNTNFTELCNKYNSDKGTERFPKHGFSKIYDEWFNHLKEKATAVLEIGVNDGASMKVLEEYFPNAKIYGLDIDDKKQFNTTRVECIRLNQSIDSELEEFSKRDIKFDVIIDDGSHHVQDQQKSFGYLFPMIKEGGIYVIEDLHTSLCPNGQNIYGRPMEIFSDRSNTTLVYVNNLPQTKSVYLNFKQNEYISKNVESALVYSRQNYYSGSEIYSNLSMTSIIIKRKNNMNNYLEVLKRALVGSLDDGTKSQFINNSLSESEIANLAIQKIPSGRYYGFDMSPANGETMIGYLRLTNIESCINEIIKNNIEGDFIETGVWKGGACIYMKAVSKNALKNKVFVADSFCGVPPPDTDRYAQDTGDPHHTIDSLRISAERVKEYFKQYNCLDENVVFLEGIFKDTLPQLDKDQKFSLVRLDGDMYSSTMDALDNLYPKLSVGGYIIIDDYALVRCKQAVTDYREKHKITEPLIQVDQDCVYWKKEK